MLQQANVSIDELRKKFRGCIIPTGRENVPPEFFFRGYFDLTCDLLEGGIRELRIWFDPAFDASGLAFKFELIEPDLICPFDEVFIWDDLAMSIRLPPGSFTIEPFEIKPQF